MLAALPAALLPAALLLAALAALAGCRGGGEPAAAADRAADPQRFKAEAEYQWLQAELLLAQKGQPYVLFDWQAPAVLIKLKGAVVARLPMQVAGGSGALQEFRDRFHGSELRVLRGLQAKHLFTAQDQTPDSVLTIVGEVLNMDPEIMQRHIPGWFEFDWPGDLVLEVHADVAGEPVPGTDLRVHKIRRLLKRPLGEVRLKVTMDRRDALTLYRVAHEGFPTVGPLQ